MSPETPSGPAPSQHLAAIVESSEDAIISKTLEGIVKSWNGGAQRIFGYTPEEIIGKSIRLLIPAERQHEEDEILGRIRNGERVAHFETVRRAKDGRLLDISLTISPVKDENGRIVGASKIARDITQNKRTQRRLETLFRVAREIARDFNLERIVQAITDLATQACGAKFGAFIYNVANKDGESYLLYTLSGASRESFEKFGMPRNTAIFAPTFRGEGVVRSDDIRKDPRYGQSAPHHGTPHGHLPVVSYLAVPVISAQGDVHGGLFFGHDQPGIFTPEAEDIVTAIASQAAVAMDKVHLHRDMQQEIEQRRKAEAAQRLMVNEIKHRIKNTLATVLALAGQTFKSASNEEREAFTARIMALSEAHETLTQKNWRAAAAGNTAERALRAFSDGRADRIILSGPETELAPNKTLLLSMLLHELGTNAVKYGALSNATGTVTLSWDAAVAANGKPALQFQWREAGGPPVIEPTRKGFGSRLIERALAAEYGAAELAFAPSGVRCTLLVPLDV